MKRLRPLAAVMFTMLLAACMDGTPTLQASPSASAVPQIVAFEVFPNPVERGDELRVTWQVDGASRAALWPMTYDSKLGRWYRQRDPISTGSTAGEYRLTVPPDADRTLRFELEATDTIGNSVTATSDEILLVCHPIFFDLPWAAWCPNPPQTTPAAFQAFEGGYMIWRADTGQVYTLLQPGDGWFAFLPTNEAAQVDAPPDRHAPGEHFQRAWASLTERWRSLGWGVAPEQPYSLTLQFSFSPYGRGTSDDLYLSWPDGRIVHLKIYLGPLVGDLVGGPAWNFVNPNTVPAPAADASPVPTPFPTVAAKVPAILGFTVDPVNAKPGDRVTLSWTSTGGVTATLFEPVCCASNGGSLARDVPPNGNLTLTLDAAVERDTLTYILSVSDGEPSASKSIQIRLPCPDTYFFRPGTNDLECPSGPAVISPAAEQVFERGRMIWIESQEKVYVLLGDGQPNAPGVPPDEFSEFEDTWQPGQPESDPALSPPVALFQPLRGFGKVWRSVEWVRDGLGWALAPEQAFNAVFQRPWQTCLRQNVDGSIESCSGPNDAVQYLRAVDGRLIRMAGFGALGRHSVAQWEFWSPQGR